MKMAGILPVVAGQDDGLALFLHLGNGCADVWHPDGHMLDAGVTAVFRLLFPPSMIK